MGVEIFLNLKGITGESEKANAVGWIEVFSFSNGASNPSSVAFGTGSGAGKVDLSSLSIQKQLDKASPFMFSNCCAGTHVATGNLIVREATGDIKGGKIYFQYDMTEVFIDSISWGERPAAANPRKAFPDELQVDHGHVLAAERGRYSGQPDSQGLGRQQKRCSLINALGCRRGWLRAGAAVCSRTSQMTARELFQAGKLSEAITKLSAELRDNPTDVGRRTFLFELLCFAGEYDRAEKHIGGSFRGRVRPRRGGLPASAPRWRPNEAVTTCFQKGDYPGTPADSSPIRGTFNGQPFETIEDSDPRVGPRLEVIGGGHLYVASAGAPGLGTDGSAQASARPALDSRVDSHRSRF